VVFCLDGIHSSFERQELRNCCMNFERVLLVCFNAPPADLRFPNLEVRVLNFEKYRSGAFLLKAVRHIGIILQEFFTGAYFSTGGFKQSLSSFTRCIYIAERIKQLVAEYIKRDEKIILYSFWCNQWATAICLLKKRNGFMKALSRTHGTDLYEERSNARGKIPYRFFHLEYLQRILPVSDHGARYLKAKYPRHSTKIQTLRLGTISEGLNPLQGAEQFTVLSCARIRDIKRIFLIPEILMKLSFPVKWIHIGGKNENDPTNQVLAENIRRLNESANPVSCEFKGEMSNEEVLAFYKTVPVNLLISVSETEGLPVSMMEAISFGVPVLSTDVGGCAEIVNERTGRLIPPDFELSAAAAAVEEFRSSYWHSSGARSRISDFWKSNYSNTDNFRKFVSLAESL
jgi:glycosyltransferase involved in cell wall biosynthesis